MYKCYTISGKNVVKKGISVKRDLINKCDYITSEGSYDTERVKIYGGSKGVRIKTGRLFNLTFREMENTGEELDGTLVQLDWSPKVKGSELVSNINESFNKGYLECVTSSSRLEGMSLDFSREIRTTTYIIKVNEDCVVEFYDKVSTGVTGEYRSKETYRISLYKNSEPKIVKICVEPLSYSTKS